MGEDEKLKIIGKCISDLSEANTRKFCLEKKLEGFRETFGLLHALFEKRDIVANDGGFASLSSVSHVVAYPDQEEVTKTVRDYLKAHEQINRLMSEKRKLGLNLEGLVDN